MRYGTRLPAIGGKMAKEVKLILSKDALCRDYLHIYGERPLQFKTPNLDELAAKGTVFRNYSTSAPSTVMAFYGMVMGKFAHETDFQMYERRHLAVEGDTMFSRLRSEGYACHIIWDPDWDPLKDYYDYFRDDVTIHSILDLRERVGVHKQGDGEMFADDEKAYAMLARIEELITSILNSNEKVFIWLHLPHVLAGRACYGADIDMFDEYIGMARRHIPDDCIYITADHGNLNGQRCKLAYGFDPLEKSIKIPLITPRIKELAEYSENVSSIDLFEIVFRNNIPERRFVYSDTAYRAQKTRKLAIMMGSYKYIYTKKGGREELYDLRYDPDENISLMDDILFDVDRKINIVIREEYYYPHWEQLPEIRKIMREERCRIWRNGSFGVVFKSNLKDLVRPVYEKLARKRKSKKNH